MKKFLYAFSFAALLLLCAASLSSGVRADITIKMKTDGGSESTTYIKGKRQRMEIGSGTATITQCDARRTVQLNAAAKTYIATPFDQIKVATPSAANADAATPTVPVKRGGIVTSTITAKDTGERQQMFGFTARRIKTSMITESSPDACTQSKSRIDSDGWYIDLPIEFNCETEGNAAAIALANGGGGCRDEYRTKQLGTAKLGYPVKVTTTLYDDNNQPQNTFSYEVVEISRTPLDAALFDVPADYREVRSLQELYSGASSSLSDEEGTTIDNLEKGTSAAATGVTMPAVAATGAPGAKKEGIVRIGVALTRAESVGEGMDAITLAEAVRNTLINRLRREPAVEVMTLEAQLPEQLDAEATRKECDYVLYTSAAHKKGKSGGFGGFLQAAAPIADAVPIGGRRAGAVASSVATTAIRTAADVSAATKAKDELTLEYQLQRAQGNAPVAAQTLKAKAKSNGDDLISDLVGQVAGAVLAQATKK